MVTGLLFQTDNVGRNRLISPTVRLNDGSLRPFKRHAPGDFLQVGKDRSNMRPGNVCRIIYVAVCASDHFELGDNAEKRPRLYVGDFVLKLQGSSRRLDFRLASDRIACLLTPRVRGRNVENAPL